MQRYRSFQAGIFLLLLMFWGSPVYSGHLDAHVEKLWKLADNHKANPANRIKALLEIGKYYELEENRVLADSTADIALEIAQHQANDTLLMIVYNNYFDKEDLWDKQLRAFSDNEKARQYARSMMGIALNSNNYLWLGMAYSAAAKVAQNVDLKSEEAISSINKAYYYFSQLSGDSLRVRCLLDVGVLQMMSNHKIEAFRSYLDALYIGEKLDDKKIMLSAYQRLSDFFMRIGNYEKAKSYTLKTFPILLSQQPIDSVRLMNAKFNLATILFQNDEANEARKLAREIVAFAKRTNLILLKNAALVIYRSYYFKRDQKRELVNLYTREYPEELVIMEHQDKAQYYRIKAMIADVGGMVDSASYYFSLATDRMKEDYNNPALFSMFFRQYGLFLWSQGRLKEAREKLETSLDYALTSNYLPYIVASSEYLDSLSVQQNDLTSAYKFAKFTNKYSGQLAAANRQDEVLRMDLENEIRQREFVTERERLQTERRHNLQYMGITLLIGLTFTLLIMMGSFKVPRLALRAFNFLSFVFLFEFIILIIDHKVHVVTHGEPWKILAIKIVIIAGLLPLHHYVEERFVHYLTTHKLIDTSKFSLLSLRNIFSKWAVKVKKQSTSKLNIKEEENSA